MLNKGPQENLKLETSELTFFWKVGGINNKFNKAQNN